MESKISKFRQKRYFFYTIASLWLFIMPWLHIGGKHLFLISFEKKEIHLFFNTFSTQEFFLMPFLIIFFFISIFFLTTLGGRVWCGWACPQTIFRVIYRDLICTKILKIRGSITNKQKGEKGGAKGVIAVALFAIVALIAASNLLWFFVPPQSFFAYLGEAGEHKLLFGIVLGFAAFLTFDITFLGENFCVFICPYARIQSTMLDEDSLGVIYDDIRGGAIYDEHKNLISNKPSSGDCTGCQACVRICPTHIDIRKGMQLECINCLECADACSNIMSKLGKAPLINWTSLNAQKSQSKVKFMRFRTIGYIGVLAAALIGLVVMSGTKESMLLNINRNTQLYKIDFDDNGEKIVKNSYTFLFENTHSEPHSFFFSIDNENISISRPDEPVKVSPGKKAKIIVSLTSKANLSLENEHDNVVLPLIIKAYAVDDEKISITRESVFVYPQQKFIDRKD
ncbi:cytochrome c oxidase accessory protein CcoG [Campylobacter sp. JMF_06 NA1]|uniref:cytochrome c oxidase accessory protein CcoG n=1 Tax=Campylobacter sp. JMF_06 NA1 TaxID=2983823 RepID=UPI0022E9AE3F|nr:cytochrome c oxidase accessory protein CcoG [Campylobacter sp. JMF_06 NA1]MDA3078197.1 cytochrome c oxidase accessory protein CcoG [Campylobacter sp. JMF_06 NA1]